MGLVREGGSLRHTPHIRWRLLRIRKPLVGDPTFSSSLILCARATRGLRRIGMRAAWSSSCSRNAHDKNVLVRRAQLRIDQAALMEGNRRTKRGERRDQSVLLARRTRTVKLCSPGTRARLGALGVGRVRMLRSEEQPRPLPLIDVWSSGGIWFDFRNETSVGAIPRSGHCKLGRGVARQLAWALCSPRPHDQNVLPRCAQ